MPDLKRNTGVVSLLKIFGPMAGEVELSDVRHWRERHGVAAIVGSIEERGDDENDWDHGVCAAPPVFSTGTGIYASG